jgi:glycosyltransferase involved in cell wall biosynthesis
MNEITIVSATALNSGGIGRVTYNWAREFADIGRSVRVLCSSADGVNTDGFEVRTISPGRFSYYWKDLYYSLKVRLRAELEGKVISWLGLGTFFDVDYIHMGSVPMGLQNERLAQGGVGSEEIDLRKRVDNACFSLYNYHRTEIQHAPNVIVPSPEIKRTLDRYGPNVPAKTTVVPHGVSKSFVQWDDKRDHEQVLFVGGTMPRKGISTLLSAWSKYEGPEKLLIAGYGDQDTFNSLRVDHGISRDRAEFLGFVDEDRLRELYRESKMFVLPSYEEGFGIPVLEALAAGTPVVCSDTVGSRFVLDECDGGMTFAAGDADALQATLTKFLNDDSARQRAGVRGRDHVASNYLWQHIVADFDDVLFSKK